MGIRLARPRWVAPLFDLDLAMDAGRPLNLSDTANLVDVFEESRLPWRVDIVDLMTCSERFRLEVESHAVLMLDLSTDRARADR